MSADFSAALAAEQNISEETIALLAKPMMPKKLYFLAANWGWRQPARKNGRKDGRRIELRARPYAQ